MATSMGGYTGPNGKTGNKLPSGYKTGQVNTFSPEMMEQFMSLFQHLGPDSYLSRLASGDEDLFAEIEQPALRQFGALQGNIASKFSGMGMGGRRSSGFGNTMNQASSDFASNLQSQRQGMQNQAIKDLVNMSSTMFQNNPWETNMVKKKKSFGDEFMSALMENLGSLPGTIAKTQGLGM